jgi:hypothetical protein
MNPDDFDYAAMNPGIRGTVRWLRDHGFETVSSGDGVTHDCPECDANYPYVTISCKPKRLVRAARALVDLLCSAGIMPGEMTENGPAGVVVQAGYEPISDAAWLDLAGLDDARLRQVLLADVAATFDFAIA